jgi:hypothetical protein
MEYRTGRRVGYKTNLVAFPATLPAAWNTARDGL